MAFLFAYDRKPLREEELASSRVNSRVPSRQPSIRANPADSPLPTPEARIEPGDTSLSPSSPAPKRRSIVIPDHVAFKYLEEDPAVTVVKPRSVLYGYELYLVEQWPCSRQSPTLVIATYTGDQRHSIVVGVLGVPADQATWSPRLRILFKAMQNHHARPRQTPLGELMVTNLSSFPSALTVIPVPEGDIRKYQKSFMVNENLKRMCCAGRSGLTLTNPTQATQAKFYQLYRVSERVPLFEAVLELVKLCQVALCIFGNLDAEYTDGLLCDVTETAIRNWWIEIGTDYYNLEPSDGILGPTTVAALLGALMGAKGRLHSYGANVPKDVFDIDGTRRAVTYFQRSQKFEKTGRLDRQTLLRLQTATARAAAGEGWGVPRAVKSTMAEIGGKRGEIVREMVSGRDKAGIGEIETTDIDIFISLVSGERAKWLWHGKPRRTTASDSHSRNDDVTGILTKQETSSSRRTLGQSLTTEEDVDRFKSEDGHWGGLVHSPSISTIPSTDNPGERDPIRKTVFKSVAGKVSDARSGLGRIKDAVGGSRKTHGSRPSVSGYDFTSALTSPGMMAMSPAVGPPGPAPVPRAFSWKNKPDEYAGAFKKGCSDTGLVRYEPQLNGYHLSRPPLSPDHASPGQSKDGTPPQGAFEDISDQTRGDLVGSLLSAAGAAEGGDMLNQPVMAGQGSGHGPCTLRRRHTLELDRPSARTSPDENRWPRRLSFGDAEEAVLRWEEIVDVADLKDLAGTSAAHIEELARSLAQSILEIRHDVEPWVTHSVQAVGALDSRLGRQQEEIQRLAGQLAEAHAGVRAASAELMAEERSVLGEAGREVEMLLARLEYETGVLLSKVEDVEEAIVVYERQVAGVEWRADELRTQLETESWVHWFVRTLTGIGTGPNITRAGGGSQGSR